MTTLMLMHRACHFYQHLIFNALQKLAVFWPGVYARF
jgi:hypothetical protein